MNIKELFIKLTDKTYPFGTESQLKWCFPKEIQEDHFGNYFLKIGESKTIFTSHLDTCSSEQKKVEKIIGSRFIRTDGNSILGADDKAGMTVLLYMIEKEIPGLYYFFIGEEIGCLGSSRASEYFDFSEYERCISFDRRGYNSVITDQYYGTCCSDEFAEELSKRLNSKNLSFNFSPDPTGIVTDSASFMSTIPECTNISVGYFDEHKVTEKQDILFLQDLCEAVVKIDWETLPTLRDPEDDFSSYCNDKKYITYDDSEESQSVTFSLSACISVYVSEELSISDSQSSNHENWLALISDERLEVEKSAIKKFLDTQSVLPIDYVSWNGKSCNVYYKNANGEYVGERSELKFVIPEINKLTLDDLKLLEKVN